MMMRAEQFDGEKWVHDSSTDHKGRLPLRASTGAWTASLFIIAIEFSERLSYFGLAMSLIIYLTRVIHQDLKTAAKRKCLPGLKPCEGGETCHQPRKIHEVFFFLAICLVSMGTGGHKPALESFGADQFDDNHAEERKSKMSYFNWWNFGLCSGLLLGVTAVVYIQDHVSWGAADVILTVVLVLSLMVFIAGRPFYRYRAPTGSPVTPMLRVLVAAFAKRNLPCPSDPSRLYEVSESEKTNGRLLCHTEKLKFLDKAATVEDNGNPIKNKGCGWRLATVTQVEEVKLMLNMVPIWTGTLPFGICLAQASAFFIKQGTTLNWNITGGFLIPAASIYALTAVGMILTVTLYEKVLVPVLRQATGNERGIKILQRIGIGMVFSVVGMVVAALVERKRLGVARSNPDSHSPLKGSKSMSVFWLAPQFIVIGIGDGFTLVGLQEYFYDQVPDSMRSLGIAFYLSVIGAANFLSSLQITAVDQATTGRDVSGWLGKDLNSSRLDNFYRLLAAVALVNLSLYVVLARRYSYKSVQRSSTAPVADCSDKDTEHV